MKKYYILMFVFFLTSHAFSQSVVSRDITWSSSNNTELHSNVNIVQNCKLITRSNIQIDYIINESNTFIFSIHEIVGVWNDPNMNGAITYHVQYQGRPGIIIIERTDTGISAILDFTDTAADALKQKIFINSFE